MAGLQLLLKWLRLFLWSSFSSGAKIALKNVWNNGSSGSYVIICVKVVRRSQEKPCFHSSGSLVQKWFWFLRAHHKKPFNRWPFGIAPRQEPQEDKARAVPKEP